MTTFNDASFTDQALKTAERITLSDLLQSPVTQCWALSMICNAIKNSHKFDGFCEEEDELLTFRLLKINNSVGSEDRQAAFSQCGTLINEQRQAAA